MNPAIAPLTRRAFVRMAALSSVSAVLGAGCQAGPTEAPAAEEPPAATATTAPTSTPAREPTPTQAPVREPAAAAAPKVLSTGQVSIEWLGHGSFKFESPEGKTILLDPWLETNPSCPPAYKTLDFSKVDLILFTHGHVDHFMLPDAKTLIERYNPKVIAPWELEFFLKAEVPLADTLTFNLANKGATSTVDGLEITMVGADHSSGAQLNGFEGVNKYVGEPCGYVIAFENGFKVYHSGDTGLMADMQLVIGDYYAPDLAILPIGGVFTMGPREAAYACQMIRPRYAIPEHYGTFPVLAQSADEFVSWAKQYAPATAVSVLELGGSIAMPPASS
jgi:L-ascorbate metabolism protein UlaG (beta-lactamase superfamily)